MICTFRTLAAASGLALMASGLPVQADPIEDFYKGKTLRIVIGYGAGGGYDLYGRVFAQHIGNFIPGKPTVIAQNMPGAGSFLAAKYLYNVAPKDGTHFGSVAQTLPLDAAMRADKELDAGNMPYIGRLVRSVELGIAPPGGKFKSWEEGKTKEVVVGATGSTSPAFLFPAALAKFGGMKFKVIMGYKGSTGIALAAERKEVDVIGSMGVPLVMAKHPDWIEKGTATIFYQGALSRHPLVPNVPALPEFGTSDDGKAILRAVAASAEFGRSIITTPGVPAERLAAVRKAFDTMVKDPAFLADMKKRKIMIEPATGDELDKIKAETLSTPPRLLAMIKELVATK